MQKKMKSILSFVLVGWINLIVFQYGFAVENSVQPVKSATENSEHYEVMQDCASSCFIEFEAVGRPSALKILGRSEKIAGTVVVNGKKASGKFELPVASLATGIETRDRHMKEKYLELAKYATIALDLIGLEVPQEFNQIDQKIATLPKGKFEPLRGILNLHGQSKPILIEAELNRVDKKTIEVDSKFSINLNDFQIGIPSFAGITIAEKVDVKVHLILKAKVL